MTKAEKLTRRVASLNPDLPLTSETHESIILEAREALEEIIKEKTRKISTF